MSSRCRPLHCYRYAIFNQIYKNANIFALSNVKPPTQQNKILGLIVLTSEIIECLNKQTII